MDRVYVISGSSREISTDRVTCMITRCDGGLRDQVKGSPKTLLNAGTPKAGQSAGNQERDPQRLNAKHRRKMKI
jgi:hypothetical protein